MPKKRSDLPQLTKAEERVMKVLWQHNPAFIRDIIAGMPSPRPHANTVNTILKILAEKGFVSIEPIGNANRFHVLISKEAYSSQTISQIVKSYFNDSFADLVSFFAVDKDLDVAELESILKSLKKKKQ
jgi:BlaI family penicillinase repressor